MKYCKFSKCIGYCETKNLLPNLLSSIKGFSYCKVWVYLFNSCFIKSILNLMSSHPGWFCHMLFFSCCLTLCVKENSCADPIPIYQGCQEAVGWEWVWFFPLTLQRDAVLLPCHSTTCCTSLAHPSTQGCICWHCSGTQCLSYTAKERMEPRDPNISTAAVARILAQWKRQRQDLVSNVHCRNR